MSGIPKPSGRSEPRSRAVPAACRPTRIRKDSDKFLLSLDVGTGTVRCVLFDLGGRIVRAGHSNRRYRAETPDSPFLLVFDPQAFWSDLCRLTRKVLSGAGAAPESVLGVTATFQRHSFVFLDERDVPVYAGPNLDTRGLFAQAEIERRLGDSGYRLTGQWPPLTSGLAKLLWFRQEATDRFKKIRTVLTIGDWVLFRLTGVRRSEPTGASASMLLDLARRTWAREIFDAFELDPSIVPPMAQAGEVVGTLKDAAARQMALAAGTPVVVSGADTHCAVLASGRQDPCAVFLVAGTTAPVCSVLSTPVTDPHCRLWTSCHLDPDRWLLEANSHLAGTVYAWLGRVLLGRQGRDATGSPPYARMEKLASAAPVGSNQTYALLGPAIMDARNFIVLRPALLLFPPPVDPVIAAPVEAGHLLRAALENVAYAVRGNLEQIVSVTGVRPERICATGGLCASRLFCQILADCLGLAVEVDRTRQGSALGAALCCAVGLGVFRSPEDARSAWACGGEVFEPQPRNAEVYEQGFRRWTDLYRKLAEI